MKSRLVIPLFCFLLLLTGILILYGVVPGTFESERHAAVSPLSVPDKEAKSVLVVGASLIARGDWIDEVEQQIRACNKDASVVRLAMPGANSAWGLSALREYFRETRADIVVVSFAGNDASLWRGFPLFMSRAYHSEIIALSQAHSAEVILATMNPAWELEVWERPGQQAYRNMYRKLADEIGLLVVDTTPLWFALDEDTRTAWVPDGLHPTEQAMRQIAVPAFAEVLQAVLCSKGNALDK
jgi:lysophospholipase L1-like esterase